NLTQESGLGAAEGPAAGRAAADRGQYRGAACPRPQGPADARRDPAAARAAASVDPRGGLSWPAHGRLAGAKPRSRAGRAPQQDARDQLAAGPLRPRARGPRRPAPGRMAMAAAVLGGPARERAHAQPQAPRIL